MVDGTVALGLRRSPLKWAGGKTRSAGTLAALAPRTGYSRYVEPFCGSAAVFFAVRPNKALLTDAVYDLIACLTAIRDDPEGLMERLDRMPNTPEHFQRVRSQRPEQLDDLGCAARMMYLNKTAFRGLWRVNRTGQFNTPYGRYDRPYYNRTTLLSASEALAAALLRCADFRETLEDCQPGDWVYLDPPYVPERKWGDFTRYTPAQFHHCAQQELAELLRSLDRRGIAWLLTNSRTRLAHDLYGDWNVAVIPTRRDISLTAAERPSADLIVSNYDLPSPAQQAAPR